ncbi:MAG: D-glycero-beta-D-manno-heptose-7-phosphate kinase, partial [Deltaproteobacteria bacterium]|nr:D-glycero-beta-D-manno-heptose-7-phosphate kinase [Deltaproteobacteria bacterium]
METIGYNYDGSLLKKHIDRFPRARVVVIGDIIMDEYIWGDVSRISPEAPVPVVEV